jgi:hypothetical protein
MTTPIDFAHALLAALELPDTDNNVAALVAAQCIEGGYMHNGALFNPLNTTWKLEGSRSVTAVNVQAYPTWALGLEATRKTLTNGLYKDILAALELDADPDVTLHAMAVSPWGWYRVVNGKRVPNGIGKAAGYQSYGAHAFPEAIPPSYLPGFEPPDACA